MTSIKVYETSDADPTVLADKTIAILGFGSQGHAHALNLHDRGYSVVVGLRPGSASAESARESGLEVRSIPEAAEAADIVSMLIPDTSQPVVYETQVAPHLEPGNALLFAHGFNIHYQQVIPPSTVDVIMVAPKSPGAMVRDEFKRGHGVPALTAVYQDATGTAFRLALAYADALGCTRAGVLETTYAAETETDLFGEQAVLCGGVTSLIKAGFETLVDAGYAPELAYFECLHELKLIVDLIQSRGLSGMRAEVSDTAEYGDYIGGPRVVGEASRKAMRELLAEIRSGAFAKRWIADGKNGMKELTQLRERDASHQLEEVGAKLRERMTWLQQETVHAE